MIKTPQIEMHVAHSCNLACESCSHYSNYGHRGLVSLEEGHEWFSGWSNRVQPEYFNLVGGEPSLHPQLADFVRLTRIHWPVSKIRVVTNGFFLHRHPDLPQALRETDTLLALSRHHQSVEYSARFQPIEELARGWERDQGIRLQIWPADERWTRRYRGSGAEMQPYEDSRPRESWNTCTGKGSKQIYLGKLWKCPALTYLRLQDAKFKLGEKWQPYLRYQPLAPDCSEEELQAFIALEEESVCGMCPATPQYFTLPLPLRPNDSTHRAA